MRNVLNRCSVPVLIVILMFVLSLAASAAEKTGGKQPPGGKLEPPSSKSSLAPPQIAPGSQPAKVKKQLQTGYCCADGLLSQSDPLACKKQGGVYYPNRSLAERACTGFCCSDGRVSESGRDDCLAKLKGTFFEDRKEAVAACRGWCCADFSVSSTDASGCRAKGGEFFADKPAAERFCREQEGWCCVGGAVLILDRQGCRLRQGEFFEDSGLAEKQCQASRGYCDLDGTLVQLSQAECRSRQGTFHESRAQADLSLRRRQLQRLQPTIAEPGYCCAGGKLFSSGPKECDQEQGQYFSDAETARKHCSDSQTVTGIAPAGMERLPALGRNLETEELQTTLPDLVIGEVSADSDCRLQVVIENRGGPIAPAAFKRSRLQISAGPHNRLPASKQYLHQADPTGRLIQPGGSVAFDTGLEVDRKQGVLVWLDSGNDIVETSDKNNRRTSNLSCVQASTATVLDKPLMRLNDSKPPAASPSQMNQMAGTLPEFSPPDPSEIVPRLAGDVFGIRVTEPVRGGYVTRGLPVQVAWQPEEDASESCRERGSVSLRLLGPGGFSRLLYSGPETPSGTGFGLELEAEAFSEIPDGHRYTVLVEKAVASGECRGESWEFSVGPIRDLGGGDLAPGERVIEILDPDPGQTITAGEPFTLRWRMLPTHLPAEPGFGLWISSAFGEAGSTPLGFGASLTGGEFSFNNETRIYSAEVTLPCYYPSETMMLELGIAGGAVRDSVSPLSLDGVPPRGSGVHLYDPRPGIIKHVGDDLGLRWAVEPALARCFPDGLQQVIWLCPGSSGTDCDPQLEVDTGAREASIPLTPGMEGTYRALVSWGGNDGMMGLDGAVSEPFEVVPPLPSDRPTLVWPERATTLYRGSTYTISWTGMEGESGARRLEIELRNPAGRIAVLGTESVVRGRFEWQVPLCDDRYLGDGYYFRLRSLDDEPVHVDSVPFRLADTGISFTGDAGRAGSFWEFDTVKRITWRTDHLLPPGATVDLILNKGGASWLTIARGVDAAGGGYNWRVGSEWRPEHDFEGDELAGELEWATGTMGGPVNPAGSDYSFVIRSGECPEAISAEGPMVRLGD